MKLIKEFIKNALPFTLVMLIANYIFIKGSFKAIIITSIIISLYQTIKTYKVEKE